MSISVRSKLSSFLLVFSVFLVSACGGTKVSETADSLNGTCVTCHEGISSAHPVGAAISCTNCHGGDDSDRPFRRAGLEDLLKPVNDPNAPDGTGRQKFLNPTTLADQGDANFPQGRADEKFQVIIAAAHNLPKGCVGPRELVEVDGDGDLDGDGSNLDRVRFKDLTPGQQANFQQTQVNDDCHAVFFWPNGIDDDGDTKVDELGEFSMFNPQDPIGLQFEFDKIDANGNNVIDANETTVTLAQSKTFRVNLGGNLGEVDVPVKLGQNLDSEFAMDSNYVRFLNPGDSRTAHASCGRNSPASSFAGNCHDQEVDVVRRSIMSYMSGVLAGAIYANGSIPNVRNLTNKEGFTDRQVQDLRDGRIAYVQNYDTLDAAFNTDLNRFVTAAIDGATDANNINDLSDVYLRSRQNQLEINQVFGLAANDAEAALREADPLLQSGLDQDDCIDVTVAAGNENNFVGNLCNESFPEPLFRVDQTVLASAGKLGLDPEALKNSTTRDGTTTVEHGADVPGTLDEDGNFVPSRRQSNRLIWKQIPLQDKARSLFVLAPIPRRSLVSGNGNFLANADLVSNLQTGQGVVQRTLMPNAPANAVVGGVLDSRQFSRFGGINPVDTALQTFRPFHSLSFPNLTGDFFFFDELQLIDNNANNDVFVLRNNPHGRGRGTGCTSCHMLYDADGVNREPTDPTVRNNGKQPGDVFLGKSPLVKSGLAFRPNAGLGAENGNAQATFNILTNEEQLNNQVKDVVAQALGVNGADLPRLQYPTGMDDFGRERFYPAVHKITTQIPSQQCEYCHAFVTRIGFAAVGRFENEGGMDFINWYSWTLDDRFDAAGNAAPDGKVTHVVRDLNANGIADDEAELGEFMNNRARRPEQDFLEFRNAVDPSQKVRIFNNLPAFAIVNNQPKLLNTGQRGSEDLNSNGLLDLGEDTGNLGADTALDLPDRPARDRIMDGRQQRSVYGGASGALLLQDVHLERGMHCIDCHFYQDSHGDGNLYARNWDTIEIECQDCHGSPERSATLVTSGPNGGHDLKLSKDQFGVKFFEIGASGEYIQRSRVVPGRQFRIPQVKDSITPGNEEFNPDAAEAMAVLNSKGENAHFAENVKDANGIERSGAGKLECSSCHSSWTPNCMTCHMDFDYGQTVGEVWYTQNRNPIAFFQLFTIIRSPFVLASAGSNERNKIMTHRSLMELHPNVTLNDGTALVEDFTFTTARGVSGVAMNQNMAHTVRLKESKDCDSCHTLTAENLDGLKNRIAQNGSPFDAILNNNILAQTLGLGSGRLGELGDFLFAASNGGLEAIDMKAESRRALDGDGDGVFQFAAAPSKNTFQGFRGQGFGSGFLVASGNDNSIINTGLNLNRNFSNAVAGGASDIIFIRNFVDPTEADATTGMFIGQVRATDIVVMAENNQLTVRVVTDRTGQASAGTFGVVPLQGVTAIDHVSSDMSTPFVYAVTSNGELAIIDLRNAIVEDGAVFQNFDRFGFNDNAIAAQKKVGTNLRDIEYEGNYGFVLDAEGTGLLRIIDVRTAKLIDRVVNPAEDLKQVAVDYLFEQPGSLDEVGAAQLSNCADPRRVSIFGIMAYVACGTGGLAVVNIEDPLNPREIASVQDLALFDQNNPGTADVQAGALNDAQGVYASDNRLFVANGSGSAFPGVAVFDVTEPANPRPVRMIQKAGAMVDPVDITGFVVPGQLWLAVSDSAGRVHAVNVTEAYNIRVRLGEHAAAARGILAGQDAESNGSKPGFRPEEDVFYAVVPDGDGAKELPRLPFFEDTNIRYTLDLRDPLSPNDPANIAEVFDNTPLVITYNLAGAGDIRFAQTQDLDRLADWSGFPVRDAWASAVNINTNCTTDAQGKFVGNVDNCSSESINGAGELSARTLTGPRFVNGKIVRGLMDTMRGVFIQEVDGFDLDGNGLGDLRCIGVAKRNDQGSVNDISACSYPAGVLEAILAN